jgi:hypothetical protein
MVHCHTLEFCYFGPTNHRGSRIRIKNLNTGVTKFKSYAYETTYDNQCEQIATEFGQLLASCHTKSGERLISILPWKT